MQRPRVVLQLNYGGDSTSEPLPPQRSQAYRIVIVLDCCINPASLCLPVSALLAIALVQVLPKIHLALLRDSAKNNGSTPLFHASASCVPVWAEFSSVLVAAGTVR